MTFGFFSKKRIEKIGVPVILPGFFLVTAFLCVAINYVAGPLIVLFKIAMVVSATLLFSTSIYFSRNRLKRWLTFEANPKYMVMTRVAFAIFGLISGVQHLGLISYGLEPYNFLVMGWQTPSAFAYVLTVIYLAGLVMLLVGYRIRIAWIIIFLFGGLVIPFSLEIFVKSIFNFYAIFISPDLWKGKKTKEGTWALPIMAVSVGVLMITAGVHKALDPVWQAGLGFYYSLNISFFPKRIFWFLLDHKWLMVLFNWMTIIAEIIMLPLLVFKRTWLYANFCVLGLGLFLSFGMSGIGIMGGPIVICMFTLFLAMSTKSTGKTLSIDRIKFFNVSFNKQETSAKLNSMSVGIAVFWYTILCSINNTYIDFRKAFSVMPIAYSGYANTKSPQKGFKNKILNGTDFLSETTRKIQPHRFYNFVWSLALFDYHHLFNRLYFKVVFEDGAGRETEIRKYFDEDGAIAWEHPLIGSEKFLLTSFKMMTSTTSEPYISKQELTPKMQKELEALVKYSLGGQDSGGFKSAIIKVIPMHQPYEYAGNYKPWTQFPWTDFFYYDFQTGQGKVLNKVKTYHYEKLQIDAFKNKVIIPKFDN